MRKRIKISRWNFPIIVVLLVLSIPISQENLAFQDSSLFREITLNGVDNPTWSWSMTEVISTEGFLTSRDPSISIDQLGNVYITYSDYTNYDSSGNDEDIFLKMWNATSLSWSTTEIVSTESTGNSLTPSVFADSNNNIHFTWKDSTNIASCGTDYDIFYKFWNATSLSWNTTEVVSTVSTEDSWKPSLGVDSSGNVYVIWWDRTDYNGAGSDTDVFFRRYDASSSSWSSTYIISTGSDGYSSYSDIGVDSLGNAHIIFRDNHTNYVSSGSDIDIFHRLWNATSLSLHSVDIVSTESTSSSINPSIAMDLEGNAHIAWQDATDYGGAGGGYDIFYKFWNATSLSWTLSEVVSTETPPTISADSPALTVDTLGHIHVVWSQYNASLPPGVDKDLLYNFRNATDSSWNITEVVSTESTANAWMNVLSADLFGNVHFAWMDNTFYGGSGGDTDVFYKRLALSHLPATVLDPIVPNPSTTGNITLDWKAVHFASKYYIYRDTSSISSLDGLSTIGVSNILSYQDNFVTNDDYYYVIVAATPYINSSISNEESVDVNGPYIPEFSPNILLAIGLIVSTALIIRLIRRKKKQ